MEKIQKNIKELQSSMEQTILELLEKQLEQTRKIKADFDAGVALNLNRLAAEIEAEDMKLEK
jgi:hypothetical protein